MSAQEDEPMALDVHQNQNPGPAPVGQAHIPETAGTGDNIIPSGAGGSDNPDIQDEEADGPHKKKLKLNMDSGTGDEQPHVAPKVEKLESRLVSLLCCTVCLDLPRAAIYQCTNGHLMCAGCFTHLLADARLRDEVATCPNCRIEINKHSATRNLAVEKAVNELPAECTFCSGEFPRYTISHHERELCEERTMRCKFERIGCPWRGPFHELAGHEANCNHPSKTGEEVMGALRLLDQNAEDERKLYRGLFDFLSYEKIHIGDLQFKPYRTDEFVHKLYYETSRFTAFNNQWVVKARINNHQRDPTLSVERQMTYQLILKSKPAAAMDVNFLILKGAFGDMKINPQIDQFIFNETNMESTSYSLALQDSGECNRLLAAKTIHFRQDQTGL